MTVVIRVERSRFWGYWVDGRWCPSVKIRDHAIASRVRRVASGNITIRWGAGHYKMQRPR
jgi:hypothetical protein